MKKFSVSVKKLGVVATSLTLVALFLATVVLPISAPTLSPPLNFDFGTASSPVASGYTRVSQATLYSASLGFGWSSSLGGRDRGAPDALRRDLCQSGWDRTFSVDLANGEYGVTVIIGDNSYAHDNIDVLAEGSVKVNDLDVAAGSFAERTFTVSVGDGHPVRYLYLFHIVLPYLF